MRPLSVQEMIVVWERGELRSPLDQALLLLHAGESADSLQSLAKLNVGERDRRLLELRQKTIGSRFSCSVECPGCGENLQFEFDTSQIMQAPPAAGTETLTAASDGLFVTFRLPNSEDLMQALSVPSIEDRRRLVLGRCVVEIEKNGSAVAVSEVAEPAIEKICDLIGKSDPLADLQFTVQCQSCGKSWQVPFDVTSFFWKEISVRARRALSEVHVLATAYGWHESDILNMSPARRELYLQMVNA
jgi:ribosomal protein S27E